MARVCCKELASPIHVGCRELVTLWKDKRLDGVQLLCHSPVDACIHVTIGGRAHKVANTREHSLNLGVWPVFGPVNCRNSVTEKLERLEQLPGSPMRSTRRSIGTPM